MQIHKTVFISYRRTSTPIARTVYDKLTAQGFDVFFDLKSITNGDFEQTILTQIANRAHFILILTPSTLERCVSPTDWVRREIEEAMKLKRNIVPLFFEGFDYADEKNHLKGDYLSILPNYNGLPVPWTYFDEAMIRVERDYLNKYLELVLHPVSKKKQAKVAEIKEEIEEEHVTPEQLKSQEYFEKGIAKAKKSDYQGAIDDYTRAILFDETFAEAYHNRGFFYDGLGKYEQAISDYDRAIEINPHEKIHYKNRGAAYGELGNYEQAISDFNRAIELNPGDGNAYLGRGFGYHNLGDYTSAITDYERALEIDPNDETAKENLKIAHRLLNEQK